MKTILMRHYRGDRTESGDYKAVHEFLVHSGCREYTYGRFDWMMTNWEYLEDCCLNRIGIWEEAGNVVGVTLFDHSLDVVYPLVLPGYEELYPEMIDYAASNMIRAENPCFGIFAPDTNDALIRILQEKGFAATEKKETVALFDLAEEIPASSLPDGYTLSSLGQEENYEAYLKCLFRGFGHAEAGEAFAYDADREALMKQAYNRAHLDKNLKISVKDAAGNYVAHCGMWYDRESDLALIEPVCVVPECRKRGLGREAVFEGLRRVKALGARFAVVGSCQQFYYSIGMIPHKTGTIWKPQ